MLTEKNERQKAVESVTENICSLYKSTHTAIAHIILASLHLCKCLKSEMENYTTSSQWCLLWLEKVRDMGQRKGDLGIGL